MSWSRICCTLLCIVGLTACGFEPLHRSGAGASADELSSVRVTVIEDRAGQILRNRLLTLLSPRGAPTEPDWVLKVLLRESIQELLVEESSFGTRANVRVTATFSLQSTERMRAAYPDKFPMNFSRSTQATGSYNLLDAESEYANIVAERDAREGVLRVLAGDIRRQVGLWLREAAAVSDGV